MDTTFTPGPWQFERNHGVYKNGTLIADCCSFHINELSMDEKQCNGQLIASAPELLECLKEAMDLLDELTLPEERKKFQQAIAKSEGTT